jgi:hypothetical protein
MKASSTAVTSPADASQVTVARVNVGPLDLVLCAPAQYIPHIDRLLEGFEPSFGPTRTTLTLTLTAGATPWLTSGPPRFEADADGFNDASEAWYARITRTSSGFDAHFTLRDESPFGTPLEPIRRELVMSALKATLATLAPEFSALLLHASAVAPSNALVFCGPSGEGKTTMTHRLTPSKVLADDAVLVFTDSSSVCGTPLRGREGHPRAGTRHPLAAILHLTRGAPLALSPLPRAEALAHLMRRVIHFGPPTERLLETAMRIVTHTPSYRLGSTLADDPRPLLAPLAANGGPR